MSNKLLSSKVILLIISQSEGIELFSLKLERQTISTELTLRLQMYCDTKMN